MSNYALGGELMDKDIQEEIVPIVIDLGMARRKDLSESSLRQFGAWVEIILGRMFGGARIPVTVKGSPSEIKSFANTLQKEKRYIEAFNKYGLDNPQTHASRSKLNNAVSNFERSTGLKWPFK